MPFAIDQILPSGVPFIDQGHPLIADCIDTVCEELACKKPLPEILNKLDQLIDDIEPYLLAKSECQTRNHCPSYIHAHDILKRLVDLRNTIESFGAAMPPSVAILETRQWAKLHIFDDDLKCKDCHRVQTKQ